MKNLLKLFVPMAVAVIATVACEQVENKPVPTEGTPLHITVKAHPDQIQGEADTRTYINGSNTILWGTGEYMKIGVYDGTATTFGQSSDATADVWNGDDEAYFTFDITPANASGSYTYYGLYPFSAAVTTSNTNPASYKVTLPATQSATATSYDPKAYILVAQPESGKTEADADWTAAFRRATALNKITLSNIPEDVKRVTITAPTGVYLAGGRHIDLTTGLSGDIYNGGGRTETVDIRYASKLSHESAMSIWFTSWDASIAVDEHLVIVAYSDAHTYTRDITVTSKPITFKEGYLNTLNVNMATAVEGVNTELADGNYVILAKNGETYYSMKAENDGSNRLVSLNYTGSTSSYNGDADIIWAVAKSGDSYTIKNGTNYIGWSSGNTALLIDEASYADDVCLMDITYNEGTYLVSSNSDASRKIARNTSNAYFAFYTGTQYKDIVFVPATVDNRTVVTLSFAESSIGKTTANYNEFTGQTATASPNVSAITSNITYAMSGDAIGTINTTSGAVTLNGDQGSATVTASFAGDENYRAAEVSYTITVSAASGPQYEKVTSLSNVTAGEYIIVNDGYYLPNAAATSAGPAKSAVTISDNKVQSVTDAMTWTFSGSASGMTIQSTADDSYYLYVAGTSNNNQVRVNTTSTHTWTIADYEGTSGAFTLKDNNNNRYCATYSAGSDWRSYNTYNAANYGDGGRVYLYKLVDTRPEPDMEWSAASATATYNTGNILSFSAPTLTPGNATDITYASTDETIATINASGVVTIAALSGNNVKEGSTTIKAIFAGDATYKPQTVTYTLNVVDNRTPVATPGFSPGAGEVDANTVVSFTCSDGGVTYYYTIDGSAPTTSSSSGSSVNIDVAKTVKVIATKTGNKNSAVASADYTIAGAAESLPFSQTFSSNKGTFTIDNASNPDDLASIWNEDGTNHYMKATSYVSSTNHNAESWLISPWIQLPTLSVGESVKLKFEQCINKFFGTVGDEATLWVKAYGGSWSKITITYPSITAGNWSSFEQQIVDLSAYADSKIKIAFKYVGTSSTAGTWEVRNVSVQKYDPLALTSISVSGQKTSFKVGDSFTFGGVVTAHYNDDSTADVTASSFFSGYDLSSAGEQTVTVSYTESAVIKTTTYGITVSASGSPSTSTLTFTAACGGSGTADDGAEWTVTSDGTESNFDSTYGIHYGTNNASVTYVQLATSDISGTVSQVIVRTRDARATATVSVTVGDTVFTCSGSATATNSSADYTFTGSGTGTIVVRVDRGSSNTKAIYVKSVAVTYTN